VGLAEELAGRGGIFVLLLTLFHLLVRTVRRGRNCPWMRFRDSELYNW
jgi:hypothetical protein